MPYDGAVPARPPRAPAPRGAAAPGAPRGRGWSAFPEALVWVHQQAGYLSTGDAVPATWQSAAGDVLRPEFLLGMIVFWATGAAGGAALGTALGRLRTGTAADLAAAAAR